jgi:hypothetical protein
MRRVAVLLGGLATCLMAGPAAAPAQDYDPGAPCGRDANGIPYPCTSLSGNMLEATCLTTANPHYCLPYHQRACQVSGFALACRVYEFGRHCQGGDPNLCQYYTQLLQANSACALNGDANACGWLQSQGLF